MNLIKEVEEFTQFMAAPFTWLDFIKAALGLCLDLSLFEYLKPGYLFSIKIESLNGLVLTTLPLFIMMGLWIGWKTFFCFITLPLLLLKKYIKVPAS